MKDTRDDLQVIFTGHTEIDRTEFNVQGERWSKVKEGITAVSKKVKIEVSILGKQFQMGPSKVTSQLDILRLRKPGTARTLNCVVSMRIRRNLLNSATS